MIEIALWYLLGAIIAYGVTKARMLNKLAYANGRFNTDINMDALGYLVLSVSTLCSWPSIVAMIIDRSLETEYDKVLWLAFGLLPSRINASKLYKLKNNSYLFW